MKRPQGSFPQHISRSRDAIDFWLTRVPPLYLLVERYRRWINWDKRLYLSLIRPGDVVLDIGANTGTHTVMFSHLVGRSGRVLAFEPVPASIERLRETLRNRSRFSNVDVFETAIGNPASRKQVAVMRIPGKDFTHASLKVQTAGSWEQRSDVHEYSCVLTSIDAETSEAPLQRLDFVKVDVEGGELDALKGAARELSRHRPLIYCEVYDAWTEAFGYTSAELFAFVHSLGYIGARVISEDGVHAWALDAHRQAGFDVSSNVLFFADNHTQLIASLDRRFSVEAEP